MQMSWVGGLDNPFPAWKKRLAVLLAMRGIGNRETLKKLELLRAEKARSQIPPGTAATRGKRGLGVYPCLSGIASNPLDGITARQRCYLTWHILCSIEKHIPKYTGMRPRAYLLRIGCTPSNRLGELIVQRSSNSDLCCGGMEKGKTAYGKRNGRRTSLPFGAARSRFGRPG